MLHQAISLGSAAAALGALRMDMLTPELREIMPFDHINEAWEIILERLSILPVHDREYLLFSGHYRD